jgi:exonuclease III
MSEFVYEPKTMLDHPTHYPQRMYKCEDYGHDAVAAASKRKLFIYNLKTGIGVKIAERIIDATILIKKKGDNEVSLDYPKVVELPLDNTDCKNQQCSFLPDHNPHSAILNIDNQPLKIIGWNIEGCCGRSYGRSDLIENYVCRVLKQENADIICIQEVIIKSDLKKYIYNNRLEKFKYFLNINTDDKWNYVADNYTGAIFYKSDNLLSTNIGYIEGIPKPDIRPILYVDFKPNHSEKICRVYNIHLVAKEGIGDKRNETRNPLQKPHYHFSEMLRLILLTNLKEFLQESNYVIFCGDHNDEEIITIYNLITKYLNDSDSYILNNLLNTNIKDIKDLYMNLIDNINFYNEYFKKPYLRMTQQIIDRGTRNLTTHMSSGLDKQINVVAGRNDLGNKSIVFSDIKRKRSKHKKKSKHNKKTRRIKQKEYLYYFTD